MNKNLKNLKTLLSVTKIFAFLASLAEFILFGACIIYLIRYPNISEIEITYIYSILGCDETNLIISLITTLITSVINFICLYLAYHWLKKAILIKDIFDDTLANDLRILAILTIVMFFIHLIIMTIIFVAKDMDALSNIVPLFPIGLVELFFHYLLKYGYQRCNKGE